MIYRWLLLVLDMEAHERHHAVNQGQLPPVLGLGHLSKSPRVSIPRPEVVHKAHQVKEPWVVHKLGEAGNQEVTRVGQVMFARLIKIQVWHYC